MKVMITGSNGQLGRALQEVFPASVAVDVEELDITSAEAVKAFEAVGVEAIINAAAWTNVDGAELKENADLVEAVNVAGVKNLAEKANDLGVPLVQISTEYVFDGEKDGPYVEDDETNGLSVYGKSKVRGEEAALTAEKHYIVRTTSLIGDGNNFVRIMLMLAEKGVNPSVVNDQTCRLTFSDTLAEGVKTLLESEAEYGTYHLTNDGQPATWAEIARKIFKLAGADNTVTEVSTEEYFKSKDNVAHRPRNSVVSLDKVLAAGVKTPDWREKLKEFVQNEIN